MRRTTWKLLLVVALVANALGLLAATNPASACGACMVSVPNDAGSEAVGIVSAQVNLNAPAGPGPVTFDYTTEGGGTATAGDDYTAQTATNAQIAQGNSSFAINIPITDDAVDEPNETIVVLLTNVTNAVPAVTSGTITITDNDDIELSIADPVSGFLETGAATFDVTLTTAHTAPVSVGVSAGGISATPGTDFTAPVTPLVFAIGETAKQVSVPIVSDNIDEDTEEFTVTIADPGVAGVALGQSLATGGIIDDDPTPELSIDDVSMKEGKKHRTTRFVFTVSTSNPSAEPIQVDFDTQDGTARAGSDYTAISGDFLTIPAGQTTGTITVAVRGDRKREKHETFTVVLGTANNATVGPDDQGTGTIRNDDRKRRR